MRKRAHLLTSRRTSTYPLQRSRGAGLPQFEPNLVGVATSVCACASPQVVQIPGCSCPTCLAPVVPASGQQRAGTSSTNRHHVSDVTLRFQAQPLGGPSPSEVPVSDLMEAAVFGHKLDRTSDSSFIAIVDTAGYTPRIT